MWIDDIVLKQCHEDLFCKVWAPDRAMVVAGNSNEPERECNLDVCQKDGVDVLKRYGGGGTVVLYPGCLIISLGAWVTHPYKNDYFFQKLNTGIADVLESKWPKLKGIKQEGISDLCLDGRKFGGTSLFRSRNFLLYQASLICKLDISVIERYLPYPSKAPDYRQNRSHRDFLFGLTDVEAAAQPDSVKAVFEKDFIATLRNVLSEDLIAPQKEQFQNLLNRAANLND